MFRRIIARIPMITLMWAVVVLFDTAGCKGAEEEPQAQLRPSFSESRLSLRTGETKICRILNATDVSVVSVPECVDVVTDGVKLHVTGLASGVGELLVSADGMRLRCVVEVIGVDNPVNDDDPETNEEIAARLTDSSMRITAGAQALSYSVPGTIFSIDMLAADAYILSPGCVFEAIDISSGRELSVKFSEGLLLQSLPAAGASHADISVPQFFINSTAVKISSAKVMKYIVAEAGQYGQSITASILWIRLITTDNVPVWVVMHLPF